MDSIQGKVEDFLTDVDRTIQRPRLKKSFECCTLCASDSKATMVQFQQCLTQCRSPVQEVEQSINFEMNKLQERLQRCSMSCQDKIDEMLPSGREPNADEQTKIRGALTGCIDKCAIEGMNMLPKIRERIAAAAAGKK